MIIVSSFAAFWPLSTTALVTSSKFNPLSACVKCPGSPGRDKLSLLQIAWHFIQELNYIFVLLFCKTTWGRSLNITACDSGSPSYRVADQSATAAWFLWSIFYAGSSSSDNMPLGKSQTCSLSHVGTEIPSWSLRFLRNHFSRNTWL